MILSDPCKEIWRKALLLPFKKDLKESLVWELSQYYRLPKETVVAKCENATIRLAKLWREIEPKTENEINKFYTKIASRIYPFELMWYHSTIFERTPLDAVLAMKYAQNLGYKRCLDFGCGVGSHGIVFRKNGFEVTLYDISKDLLDFANWRFVIRGLKANLFYNEKEIPDNYFEIVIAFDVLEHVSDPIRILKLLNNVLITGGILCLTMPRKPKSEHPLHISFFCQKIEKELERLGFLLVEEFWNGKMYYKFDHSVSNKKRYPFLKHFLRRLWELTHWRRLLLVSQQLIQTYHWYKINGKGGWT